MKKVMFAVLITLACGLNTNAQLLRFGIKGGPNFSNFSGGADGIDYKARTSFHAGVVAEIKPFPNFSIQPELLYTSQGAEVEGAGDFNLDYVAVPVLAKFYLISDKLSLEAGPQFSFLVKDAEVVFDEVTTDADSESFDFAIAGGASLYVTKSFFASARYTIGLTDVSKDADVQNAVFQISVGYMF